MNIVNIMNFVRATEPRCEMDLVTPVRHEIELNKRYGFPNTFLLQYDALLDDGLRGLFLRERDGNMETGLWLEMVRPLVQAVGLPWRGNPDWGWDWHIVPGFSMAYTQPERVLLIDEAMRLFLEVFGEYPRSVGSWMIDSFSLDYMCRRYGVRAFGLCRNQWAVDAYTLWGGRFNQGYYASRSNELMPDDDRDSRIAAPVFRLLGPDPIYNYDTVKYSPAYKPDFPYDCFTMEPCWYMGSHEDTVRWFFRTYFDNENLGFGYMQIGQENSFGDDRIMPGLEIQYSVLDEYVRSGRVTVMKMGDTGEWFARTYPDAAPACAVVATDDWTGSDIRSLFYDSGRYTANLFVRGGRAFFRSLHCFDSRFPSPYLNTPCAAPTATVETLPVMDTFNWDTTTGESGIFLDGVYDGLTTARDGGTLLVTLSGAGGDVALRFSEDVLEVRGSALRFRMGASPLTPRIGDGAIGFRYKDFDYSIGCEGRVVPVQGGFDVTPCDGVVRLSFRGGHAGRT